MGPRMYISNISVKYSEENSPGKFQRSGNFGSKSAEFVEGSDSIVTLTHSEGQHSNLRLRGSKLQKCYVYAVVKFQPQIK